MPTLDEIDDLLANPSAALQKRKRKKQATALAELPPEEEDSLLANLGQGAMSGLSLVGHVLDKHTGSRALRGLLAGKPRELASMLPFSDTLGITRPEDITSGNELLGNPKDTSLFTPEGAAGFAVEAVLDPTLPFTGFLKGGLTAGGKALKAAGGLDDVTRALGRATKAGPRVAKMQTLRKGLDALEPLARSEVTTKLNTHLATKGGKLDDLLDAPMGGNLEFWPTGSVIGKAGGIGEKVAQVQDKVGDVLRYGNIPGTKYSPGRHFAQLFNQKGSGGLESKVMQQAQEGPSAGLVANKEKVLRPVYQAAEHYAKTPHDQRALMRELEGIDQPTDLSREFLKILPSRDKLAFKNMLSGVQGGLLQDAFIPADKYIARRGNFAARDDSLDFASERLLNTAHGSRTPRAAALRNMTRGSDTINDILADPAVLGANSRAEVVNALQTNWASSLPQHSADQIDDLAGIIHGFKGSHGLSPATKDIPNFWVHPVVAARDAGAAAARAHSHAQAIFDGLQVAAKETTSGPVKTLGETLTAGGILHGDQSMGGLQEMANRLGMSIDDVKNMPIPKNVYDDVKRMRDLFDSPSEVNKLVEGIDSVTNLFKAGVLTWPARYARDLFSGQVQNMVTGEFSLSSLKLADNFVKGKQIDALQFPVVKQMLDADGVPHTQENANAALRAHLAAMGMAHPGKGTFSQVGQQVNTKKSLEGLANEIPGHSPMGLLPSLKHAKQGGTLNPLDIKGVFGREETKFMPARGGEALGNYTDSLNRLAPYLNMLKRGVDPQEAFAKVMGSQVEYGNRAFTPFERTWMSRLAPFYKFTRGMLPFVLGRLADEPSGRLAQIVRGQGRTRDDQQFVPSHIAQTTAMPIPGAPEGSQRFLTSLGLMHEDPLNIIRPGQTAFKSVSGTLEDLAGRLNPLAKAPLELAAGKQLFSGRDLQDLEGNLGRIGANLTGRKEAYDTPILLEQAISNSPLSRVATTLRTLTDTRKGVGAKASNLLSGVRVQDVDQEKGKNIAMREGLEDLLRGKSGIRQLRPHLYSKEEDLQNLSENDKLALALYKRLATEATKKARKAKPKKPKKETAK